MSPRSWSITSRPSISGRLKSSRIQSGDQFLDSSIPSAAEPASAIELKRRRVLQTPLVDFTVDTIVFDNRDSKHPAVARSLLARLPLASIAAVSPAPVLGFVPSTNVDVDCAIEQIFAHGCKNCTSANGSWRHWPRACTQRCVARLEMRSLTSPVPHVHRIYIVVFSIREVEA